MRKEKILNAFTDINEILDIAYHLYGDVDRPDRGWDQIAELVNSWFSEGVDMTESEVKENLATLFANDSEEGL